jgi:tripartite-type tricarboxylate transporter receptor subunit TctC
VSAWWQAASLGAEAVYMTPKTLGEFTKSESDRWAATIKAANLKVE